MWHKACAQLSQVGPAGQGLVYFRKPFHTRVKEGRWSWSVMPKVGAARKLGCRA
jgi:hypothetical protein